MLSRCRVFSDSTFYVSYVFSVIVIFIRLGELVEEVGQRADLALPEGDAAGPLLGGGGGLGGVIGAAFRAELGRVRRVVLRHG